MKLVNFIKTKTTNFRYSIRHSKKIGFRILRPIYITLRFSVIFLINYEYRSQFFAHLKYRKHYHQVSNFTLENRYPDLFTICREYFKDRENVRILSFGCSTGEETYSINQYMPTALIVGTDISPYNLKQCSRKEKKVNISFVHSLSEAYQQLNNFDAIFCLAVLQHVNNRQGVSIATKYTFQQFEKQIIDLDKKLKDGGLIIIDQSDFNLMETCISSKYFPLAVAGNIRENNDRPLFNSENIKVSEENNCYRVFCKKK